MNQTVTLLQLLCNPSNKPVKVRTFGTMPLPAVYLPPNEKYDGHLIALRKHSGVDALLHEWAHFLCETHDIPGHADHCDTFGLVYARVNRAIQSNKSIDLRDIVKQKQLTSP